MLHVIVFRSLQQNVDLLNRKLADSNLRVTQLEAEVVVKGQHDAGSKHNTVRSETGLGKHDVLLEHAGMARDVRSLKAQVSSYTCHVYDPLLEAVLRLTATAC